MKRYRISVLQKNFAEITKRAVEHEKPVIVTHDHGDPMVLMSLADYRSREETAYLLRSPANARRLIESIAQGESDKIVGARFTNAGRLVKSSHTHHHV